MSAAANENGLDAANDQPAKTFTQNTNDLDYPTGQRNSKAEANLRAILALNGHSVTSIEALSAFAVKLGVMS